MATLDDRLDALAATTAPAPAPPALDDLRARARARTRARRRRRAALAASGVTALVAVLAWSLSAGTDRGSDVVAGPHPGEPTGDPCAGTTLTSPAGPEGSGVTVDDPVQLACQALQHYGNDGPPAAVRLGPVGTETFRSWHQQHTEAIGAVNGPSLPDTVTVLLVRARDGGLSAPRPRAGRPGAERLTGDTVYVVFADRPVLEDVTMSGTGTWAEILAAPWAAELDEIEVG